eukprot:366570_1
MPALCVDPSFMEHIVRIIDECVAKEEALTRTHHPRKKSIGQVVSNPSEHLSSVMHRKFTAIPMGTLEIAPPRPEKHNAAGPKEITDPWEVVHTGHATFDMFTRSYDGIPDEWLESLQKQFGLSPDKVEGVRLPEYHSRIPSVLVQMKEYLIAHGGLNVVGIFRLAPDKFAANDVKKQLNMGTFTNCEDVNCVANLIKVWFRDLPEHLFDFVDHERIACATEESQVDDVISLFAEPMKSILLWLLDLCVCVSSNQAVNKMTPTNLAIVFCPNMISENPDTDPMSQLIFSQKAAQFLTAAIKWDVHDTAVAPCVVYSMHDLLSCCQVLS